MNKIVLIITLCIAGHASAQTRTNLSVGLIGNALTVSEVRSYIQTSAGYKLYTEGINMNGHFTPGASLGINLQHDFRRLSIYGGIAAAYQRAWMTYHNRNLFYYQRNAPTREHTFSIDIKTDYILTQIPVGVMIPLYKNFFIDLGGKFNMVVMEKKDVEPSDKDFAYQLVNLRQRTSRQYLFEASGGIGYALKGYSFKLTYYRGLTSLQAKASNCYNHLVPADVYFSGINLTAEVGLWRLFAANGE